MKDYNHIFRALYSTVLTAAREFDHIALLYARLWFW